MRKSFYLLLAFDFLTRMNWVLFGYLLCVFTKRKRFTAIVDGLPFGEIVTSGVCFLIPLFNNRLIELRKFRKFRRINKHGNLKK